MQKKTRLITARQLQLAVFICLITDIIINPRTSPSAVSSSAMILAMIINTALIAVLTLPLFWFVNKYDIYKLLSECTFRGKIISVLLFIVIGFSAAQGIVQSETFYRFVSDNLLPVWVFIALVIIVAIYGAKMSLEPIIRSGVIVAAAVFISVSFIILANASQFRLENLQFANNIFQDTAYAVQKTLKFPSEIFIYALLIPQINSKTKKSFAGILPMFLVVFLLIAITQELVLGKFSALQIQPLHTLARIGSISVFTRIDAVHVSIWMMMSMFRIALHFLLMTRLVKLVGIKKGDKVLVAVSAAMLIVFTLFSFGFKQYNFGMCTSILTLFLACAIPLVFYREREMYEIKNSNQSFVNGGINV